MSKATVKKSAARSARSTKPQPEPTAPSFTADVIRDSIATAKRLSFDHGDDDLGIEVQWKPMTFSPGTDKNLGDRYDVYLRTPLEAIYLTLDASKADPLDEQLADILENVAAMLAESARCCRGLAEFHHSMAKGK